MFQAKYYRLYLTLFLAITLSLFWFTRIDELIYHTFGSSEVVNLHKAIDVDLDKLKPNMFVEITGVLGSKAATMRGLRAGSLRYGEFQIRNLLGSKFFIEFDQKKYLKSFNNPFKQITVKGRLTKFAGNSELNQVKDFFQRRYGVNIPEKAMLVIVDEEPRSQLRYGLFFLVTILLMSLSIYNSVKSLREKEV